MFTQGERERRAIEELREYMTRKGMCGIDHVIYEYLVQSNNKYTIRLVGF